MPPPPFAAGFLDAYWRDVWTVVGVAGVGLTLLGLVAGLVSLWLAWRQVRGVVTAAEAAADAARRSRAAHDRLILSLAHRAEATAKVLVSAGRFEAAGLKCVDLADFLALTADPTPERREIETELRRTAEAFRRIAAEEIKYSRVVQAKWSRLCVRLGAELPAALNPPVPPPPEPLPEPPVDPDDSV